MQVTGNFPSNLHALVLEVKHSPEDMESQSPQSLTTSTTPTAGLNKRARATNDIGNHESKKQKSYPEEPLLYSESVRRKLANTSRTGQACDRCKERKMKCDTDPVACKPCASKNLPCYTTDRVTGQSRQRGEEDRVETEIQALKDQLHAYQTRYGPLSLESPALTQPARSSPPRPPPSSRPPHNATSSGTSFPTVGTNNLTVSSMPNSHYVGWPAPAYVEPIHTTPIDGMVVDVLDWGRVDLSTFDCTIMRESGPQDSDRFNFSTNAVLRTMAQQQKIDRPELPTKTQALEEARAFLRILWPFVPIVHKKTFITTVNRFYDDPKSITIPERVQILTMLAILAHQSSIRNKVLAEDKIQQSYRWFHSALYHYIDLLQDESLQAVQALSMLLILFRNLPKPGYTWSFGQKVLIRVIELNYHRDPDKIQIPKEQQNPLGHEMRKRIFHSILGICVTTGCRIGRPSPCQFGHWDVPLPMAVLDDEISETGLVAHPSGKCDYRLCIQLSRLLPLFTELFNYILSVRRSEKDYLAIVHALEIKIDAWRQDWDDFNVSEDKEDPTYIIGTLLFDSWQAEFMLYLHHPSVCTSKSAQIQGRNLEICYKATKKQLCTFHQLTTKYKACDFTWHSTVAYALGFGVVLQRYKRYTGPVTQEMHKSIVNEFNGWRALFSYADLVMCTNHHLARTFDPLMLQIVQQYNDLLERGSSSPGTSVQPRGPTPRPVNIPIDHRLAPENIRQQPSHAQHHQFTSPIYPAPGALSYASLPTQLTATPTTYAQFMSGVSMPQFTNVPLSLASLLNEGEQYHSYSPAIPATSTINQEGDVLIFRPQLFLDTGEERMWPHVSHEELRLNGAGVGMGSGNGG